MVKDILYTLITLAITGVNFLYLKLIIDYSGDILSAANIGISTLIVLFNMAWFDIFPKLEDCSITYELLFVLFVSYLLEIYYFVVRKNNERYVGMY